MSEPRPRIGTSGTNENQHAHLDPVVAAELAWGNRIARDWHVVDQHFGAWELVMDKPLHVELLRQTFRFPANFELITFAARRPRSAPGMTLRDTRSPVCIRSPLPRGLRPVDARVEL